ncbi:MAG TPA: hypothetical protein VMX17_05060 [Candidatus Glassbacteria bacterium]|nr:hypothetical protein [Candidatus Glassbacteria bacterium]
MMHTTDWLIVFGLFGFTFICALGVNDWKFWKTVWMYLWLLVASTLTALGLVFIIATLMGVL